MRLPQLGDLNMDQSTDQLESDVFFTAYRMALVVSRFLTLVDMSKQTDRNLVEQMFDLIPKEHAAVINSIIAKIQEDILEKLNVKTH